jgi:hypothetical protein
LRRAEGACYQRASEGNRVRGDGDVNGPEKEAHRLVQFDVSCVGKSPRTWTDFGTPPAAQVSGTYRAFGIALLRDDGVHPRAPGSPILVH